jgi:Na+-transporting methylmalonyl-CoA/oxaloacetate decarboxylase gamma subunit
MFRESPLLVMPLVSLVLFFGIFLAVIVRFMRKSASSFDPIAAMPLDDGVPIASTDAIKEARNVQ